MGRLQEEGSSPIHSVRFSTVSASPPTETGMTHEPTGLDLAMKLHYLKVVYIYSAETARDLTVMHVKGHLLQLFDHIPWIIGRFRRHDSGRPFIKCNDCGTRFVENRSVDESLVYNKPVGPELAYSPLIYIKMTRFKCGGLAFALSWAHIMGDPFSLSHFFNLWSRTLAGEEIYCPKPTDLQRGFPNPTTGKKPGCIKPVDPVGDLWVAPNNSKMTTYSFNVTVNYIKSHFSPNKNEFEILSGIIWKCIAKARGKPEPVAITIIRPDPNYELKQRAVRNTQMMISSVHVDFSVVDANLDEILKAMGERRDDGVLDFIVYGAKLTFVDMSEVDFYEAKVRETSPTSVYCNVQGIGDDGAVVFFPAAEKEE
ncbi:hypothetical protein N665_0008s0015, partial [Sinapis alba]